MDIEAQRFELAARSERARDGAAGESLAACAVCGCSEFRTVFEANDRLYRTTDKQFQIVESKHCRLLRLFPQPAADELRRYYPDAYWFSPEGETVDRLEDLYGRVVLRDHLNFVCRALGLYP